MKNPDYRFCVMEDYGGGPPVIGVQPTREWIYMGVMVKKTNQRLIYIENFGVLDVLLNKL